MLFFRLQTDQTQVPVALEDQYSGPQRTSCWLLGGGPSLSRLPLTEITQCPVPKMSINLAGTGLIRPTFWTSYDPSARFLKSIYLDPGITKFVHRRRGMDLVPETTFKVCECPNLYFFERDGARGFANFVSREHPGIVDWADSFVQGIDILYRLGFRRIFLAGSEMRVTPSPAQQELARLRGVLWDSGEPLSEFVKRCVRAGLSEQELDVVEKCSPYHFDEQKSIRAAANCDQHYFRIVQYLRLCRRSLALGGLELISVTPDSRLNDHFEYRPVEQVLSEIKQEIGDPELEQTRGLYHVIGPRQTRSVAAMRDFKPHNWPAETPKPGAAGVPAEMPVPPALPAATPDAQTPPVVMTVAGIARAQRELEDLQAHPIPIAEVG